MSTGIAKEKELLVPVRSSIPPVTEAKLIQLDGKFPLPEEFREWAGSAAPRAIMILCTRNPAVLITTASSDHVFKVTIEIDYLSPDFLPGLDAMLKKLDIGSNVLMNNGLRFEGFTCINEIYLEPVIPEKRLKSELQAIKDVSQVTIDKIRSGQVINPANHLLE